MVMKNKLTIFSCFLFLLVTTINAQNFPSNSPAIPLKEGQEIMFGKDIIINNEPDQNQQNITICAAFNGWMFAAYSYLKPEGVYTTLLQSTDNGLSWNLKMNSGAPFVNTTITRIALTTSGNTLANLKLFLGVIVDFN